MTIELLSLLPVLRDQHPSKTLLQPATSEISLPAIMGALSDPVRVQIVRTLAAEGELVCGTLELGISKATRSHHYRVLREAGVTNTRVDGTRRYVSLRRDDLGARFPGLLDALLAAAERGAAS
jgi:DNA-binding transcriptional ArsR family regulator